MPIVTLPDGSQRAFEAPLSIMQLAESIGLVWPRPVWQAKLTGCWLMLPI